MTNLDKMPRVTVGVRLVPARGRRTCPATGPGLCQAAWLMVLPLTLMLWVMPAGAQVQTPAPAPVSAAEPIAVRTGTHPTFGRIVFDAPPRARYRLTRNGNQVTVTFAEDVVLGRPGKDPRNVSGLSVAGSRAVFTIPAGAKVREMRLGSRIVIDIPDPSPEQAPRPAPTKETRAKPVAPTAPATGAAAEPAVAAKAGPKLAEVPQSATAAPVEASRKAAPLAPAVPTPAPTQDAVPAKAPAPIPPQAKPAASPPTPQAPVAAPRVPVHADPPAAAPAGMPPTATPAPSAEPPAPEPRGPLALVARRVPAAPNADTHAIMLPFADNIGAALFQRESAIMAVFAERRPIDLTHLRDDPVFSSATVHLLSNATLLRLPVPDGRSVSLAPTPQGWRVVVSPTATPRQAIMPTFADGRVTFRTPGVANVVTLSDPDSGATLLVGTVARAGEAITTERRTVEFNLFVTLRGIVVEPLSDAVSLRVVPNGFVLSGPEEGLALSPPATMTNTMLAAARLTRRFRLPAMPTEGLAQRVLAHVREAASMPPLARGPARKVAAETMVALGMAAEADALLRVIAEQDPKEAASPDTIILKAIAALLAGRQNEARALADPRFGGTDEDALWRAVLLATRQEGSPEAAQLFASTAPLILLYPPTLRDRLLPMALETMVLGGSRTAAEEIMAERPNDPLLRLPDALAKQARGDTDGALKLFDELARGRDQLARAKASVRAVELRLAKGQIEPAAAADALDRLLYAWRGDWRDLMLRRRIAELRQQSGGWRAALSILRDARGVFPAYGDQIKAWQQAAFAELVVGNDVDRLDPLELIGLVEENADLLPANEQGDRLRDRLADRLLALELPRRADVVLTRLMQTAPTEMGRVGFGTRLARMRLKEGDAAGALAALGQSSNPDLPPEVKEPRLLISAAALGRMGNVNGAMNALNGLDSLAADETRATILEQARDWGGAKRALGSLVRRTVPETGDLDDAQQRALLRLATAAARAGDETLLSTLREKESTRMPDGPLGDMFRLLTADPVRAVADLGRAKQEIGLARGVPAGLKALDAGARQP